VATFQSCVQLAVPLFLNATTPPSLVKSPLLPKPTTRSALPSPSRSPAAGLELIGEPISLGKPGASTQEPEPFL